MIKFTEIEKLPTKFKRDTIFLVRCPEWNSEGYQICTFNGTEFEYDGQPNDMFMDEIIEWTMLFWDNLDNY